MSRKALSVGIVASALASACAMLPPEAPREARWVSCDTSRPGARCDVRITADPGGAYSCGLGRFSVEPEYLELRGGRPVNIHWDLSRPFQFCDGDGATLKPGWSSANGQTFESFGADGKDGTRSEFGKTSACKSFWSWRWGNGSHGATYTYEIRFRHPSTGETCRIDPFIRNG